MNSVLLKAEKITKRFPGVTALDQVSFDLRSGEIHALCGENGAGKSTLIKLLSGIHPFGSYEGNLYVNNQLAHFRSITDAGNAGIAVICQELALVEEMTVAENIFLGSEPTHAGLIDWHKVYQETRLLLEKFHINIDPTTKTARLGVGQKQLIEIVKALSKASKILILDEPTAALAEPETRILMGILKNLREHGIACIYISHKLNEVFALADRITVLRDGVTIATFETQQTDPPEVIRCMVGREIQNVFPRHTSGKGKLIFQVNELTVADPHTGEAALKDISFSLHAGEVLGVGGLLGAGRTELLMHLFGVWGNRRKGLVLLDGQEIGATRPSEMIEHGMVLLSEDRRRYGLFLGKSLGFNLSLCSLAKFTRKGLINACGEFKESWRCFELLRVKGPGLEAMVGQLSGGNQQKIVIGKALMTEPRIIFMDEPTRGIDVGAKQEIYEIIHRLAEAGKAVLLVSSEMPELIGLSDHILMMHEGTITGEFRRAEATPENLLAAALGQTFSCHPEPVGGSGSIGPHGN